MRILLRFSLLSSIILLTALLILPAAASAKPKAADLVRDGQVIDLSQSKYKQLFRELERKHGFSRQELDQLFKGVTISKRVLELMDRSWEAKPYYKYFPLFITPQNILNGKRKLKEHKQLLDRIEKKFGVDREIIVAIWAVETRYGSNMGDFNIFKTLNTLFDAYPRRSEFFGKELVHFLALCKENDIAPRQVNGSYAGAFGQAQFMPSSFRSYAVSFDGNKQCDIWNSVPDALASIAHYLQRHGWTLDTPIYADLGYELKDKRLIAAMNKGRKGRVAWRTVRDRQRADIPPSPGGRDLSIVELELNPQQSGHKFRYVAGYPNFQTITEYNHSNFYAMAVSELAEAFGKP
ncbi:Transglycosylase SLT domain-containing protein [Candidatus Electronema halotolerans]